MEHLDVLDSGEGGKLPGEGKNLNAVYAKVLEKGLLFFPRVKDAEIPCILLKDSPWMRPECNHNGLLPPFTGRGDHCLKYMTMPKMDTVKESCGYYSHFTHSKS